MVTPVQSQEFFHFIKSEAHGETGDGKSKFGASYPGPRYWFDPTHGTRFFQEKGVDFVTHTMNPDEYFDTIDKAIEMAFAKTIQTIVLDDVTVIQDQMRLLHANDPDQPTMDEWAKIKGPLNRKLFKLCAAPVHVLITSRASMIAAESKTVDGKEKIANVHKAARPKAWDDWIYPCDFGFFFYSRGSELAPDKLKYFAQIQKSRAQGFESLRQGKVIEDPTFDKLFAELLEATKDAPPAQYDDPASATAAAQSGRTPSALLDKHAAAIKAATSMPLLSAAWGAATVDISAGKFDKAQQESLLATKNATKALIQGGMLK